MATAGGSPRFTNRPIRSKPWWRIVRRFDRFFGRREAKVFSLLGHFIPDTSVARSRRFQHLLYAKLLSDAARDGIKYAALVVVVAASGTALQSSLVTIATLLPTALLGLYAGEVADSLSKRLAIASSHALAAVACFVVPTVLGTHVASMFVLVLFVSSFSLVASPAESSAVPLVANDKQLASATSMMGMAAAIGSMLGTAFMAPVLLKLTSARVVFYVSGILLLVASTRVLHIYSKRDATAPGLKIPPIRGSTARVLGWLFSHKSVATMVGVSILTGVSNVTMATLAPIYVRDVLNNDPANTVFVMGPSGIAMAVSLLVVPWLVGKVGERMTAALGFGLVVIAFINLGLVDHNIAVVIDPLNPLRVLGVVGLDLATNLRTAVLLSIPLGLGVGLTGNAVTTYINRRVPITYQGRTFAARNTLQSAIAVIPLLAVSGLASFVGVSTTFILMPIAIYGLLLTLLWVSRRFGDSNDSPRQVVMRTFWEEIEDTYNEIGPESAL